MLGCRPPLLLAPCHTQYFHGLPEFKRRGAALAGRALRLLQACEPLARRHHSAGRQLLQKQPPGRLVSGQQQRGAQGGQQAQGSGESDAAGEDEEEQDERAAALAVEIADDVLERLDKALDAAAEQRADAIALPSRGPLGANNYPTAGPRAGGRGGARVAGGGGGLVRYSASLPRPQEQFVPKVDNSNTPFVPAPAGKPRAASSGAGAGAGGSGGGGSSSSGAPHPYATELGALTYPPWQLEAPAEPAPVRDLAATPCTWVGTPALLTEMVEALKGEREVAVDLEHHSYRWGLRLRV